MYCKIYLYLPEDRDYEYTGDYQVFIAPKGGEYKIELWGASGGNEVNSLGGKGAYTKGTIELEKSDKLYVYVGEHPNYTSGSCYLSNPNNSFNGSTLGGCVGGGGATDVRLEISDDGAWDDFGSLKSRIMVAAGGGAGVYGGTGGAGGSLIGGAGNGYDSRLATRAGEGATQMKFQFGDATNVAHGDTTGIAGNGYYAGEFVRAANAGGGSSFISGHPGCVAISKESTKDNIIPLPGVNIHYSQKYFTDTEMIAGNESMPNYNGGVMEGNTGNGYARITFMG